MSGDVGWHISSLIKSVDKLPLKKSLSSQFYSTTLYMIVIILYSSIFLFLPQESLIKLIRKLPNKNPLLTPLSIQSSSNWPTQPQIFSVNKILLRLNSFKEHSTTSLPRQTPSRPSLQHKERPFKQLSLIPSENFTKTHSNQRRRSQPNSMPLNKKFLNDSN